MFWFSCLQNTKQLSMPHLSNKRGVFEVTTTQRAGYAQVKHSILDCMCCYDLEVESTKKKTTHTKILNVHFIDFNTFICPQ